MFRGERREGWKCVAVGLKQDLLQGFETKASTLSLLVIKIQILEVLEESGSVCIPRPYHHTTPVTRCVYLARGVCVCVCLCVCRCAGIRDVFSSLEQCEVGLSQFWRMYIRKIHGNLRFAIMHAHMCA